MSKHYNKRWWKNDQKRDRKIFRRLEDGSKTFGELLKMLRWGPQTLTNYLKNLTEKGCIEKKKRGRSVLYTLIRSHPYVRKTLGWDWLHGADVRIHKRIQLDKLNEEQFIASWLNSVKFSFLNIIQGYLLLGKKTKEPFNKETKSIEKVRDFLEASVSDLADTISFNGEIMVKEIRLGKLNPKKIWKTRNKLLKEIKNTL
jgi:predicted transcriptional regulator